MYNTRKAEKESFLHYWKIKSEAELPALTRNIRVKGAVGIVSAAIYVGFLAYRPVTHWLEQKRLKEDRKY